MRTGAFITVMLALLIIGTLQISASQKTGAVDTKAWSFENDGAFHLKRNWTVFRNRLLAPQDFSAGSCAPTSAISENSGEQISMPDLWGPGFTTSVSSGHGTATYCRVIELPNSEVLYSLRMGTLRSVAHIYVVHPDDHGQKKVTLLHKNGGLDAAGEQVVSNPDLPILSIPYGVQKLTLVMQLSNRIHKQGGIVEIPTLDLKWRMDAADNRATGTPSALVIVLLFIALGALTMGRRSHSAIDHQLFAFLAFAAALRAAFVSDLIWDYVPDFDLARKYDLEYLSLFVVAVAYYAFVKRLLRPGKTLKIDFVIYGFSGGLIVFAIFLAPFFAPGTITLTREPVQVLWAMIVLMMVYMVYSTSITSSERRREAIVVSVAAIIYAGYEILSSIGAVTSSLEWSQLIIFVVVVVHAQVFVVKARLTEVERDALMGRLQDANRNLQNRALALDFALKRAEEASKAKSNFLATFSHELRTPLNAIIGFSELMTREVFGPVGSSHYKEYANDINSSGTHLLGLVDDILDLSSTEAGADDLVNQTVNICDLVTETLSLLKIQAGHKKITMKLEQAVAVPLLRADERKIKQVLINLVTNAIKFNKEKGSVSINVHADETGLYVDVLDTGIGIAEGDIPKVLSRFGQADSAKRSENAGVGIGLPLSEVLVRQHGGELKVTSKLGEGTCVGIWFAPDRMVHEEEVVAG